jgi:octaprenyl-diphosphate synthase
MPSRSEHLNEEIAITSTNVHVLDVSQRLGTAARPAGLRSALKLILAPVTDDLLRTDALIRAQMNSEVELIRQIGEHIIGAGGKRLRPALVLLTSRALGGAEMLAATLAATIEVIHSATLLHDDVVDRSDRRRGRITANARWGNSGAVLSGDFLYSRAFQMLVGIGRVEVMRVMADATNAIAEGEVLQLLNAGNPDLSELHYLRVIELKTARLFRAGAQVGALAADADEALQLAMADYGHHLGIAYQLVDDVLDYVADPDTTGKNVGGDLAEGKPTLPLIRAMAVGTVAQADEATGAIPYTRALAELHRVKAAAALSVLPESPSKKALLELTRFAVDRGF